MRNKHVAIVLDEKNRCVSIAQVKTIDEQTLNSYKNQKHEVDAEKDLEKAKLQEKIQALKQDISNLKDLVKHLLGYVEIENMSEYEKFLGVSENEEE